MATTIKLYKNIVDNRVFYYADFGSRRGEHFRLWVHYSFLPFGCKFQDNPKLYLPLRNARIDKGKKDTTLIARPDQDHWIAEFFVQCGFRGYSEFTVKEPDVQVFKYTVYSSPAGRLGISEGGLIMIPNRLEAITISWHKSGRLYGSPSDGTVIIHKDGQVEELTDTDLCELEDLGEPAD